jgi:hypothetical protein
MPFNKLKNLAHPHRRMGKEVILGIGPTSKWEEVKNGVTKIL